MKILVADDDPVNRRLIAAALERHGHTVLTVSDGAEAIKSLLGAEGPRIAIVDWMMPGVDGLSVCQEVRKNSATYIYLILMSARDSAESTVTGLDAGADDYLAKPVDAGELLARIRSGARILDLQAGLLAANAELLETKEALEIQATRDHLTGLWNRRMVSEQLARELNRARHERRPLSVAMIDLDGFKQINDRFGHAAGDAVLRESAAALLTQLRQYDFIGRYGGDEFVCVLPGCDVPAGRAIAERLRAIIAATQFKWGEHPTPLTLSIGLASTSTAGLDPAELVHAADEALYRAKARGRNRVEL